MITRIMDKIGFVGKTKFNNIKKLYLENKKVDK
jgi:hypothetical protein